MPSLPIFTSPVSGGRLIDTAIYDNFGILSGQLVASGVAADGFGIVGYTDANVDADPASAWQEIRNDYGTLRVYANGYYTFTTNRAFINALDAYASADFVVTAANGVGVVTQALAFDIVQDGATETDSNDTLTGAGAINGYAGNDSITGSGANDNLYGGDSVWNTTQTALLKLGGNDTLNGGAGSVGDSDTLNGGSGNDSLISGAGNDSLYGGSSDFNVNGISLNNGGNDTLNAGAGDNELYGQTGNDSLISGSGNDSLFGDQGSDFNYNATTGAYTSLNNGGNDTLNASDGDDSLDGGVGNDSLIGGNGNDSLYGGDSDYNYNNNNPSSFTYINNGGNDTLDAGAGDDILDGGVGNDSLLGGSGNDALHGGRSEYSYNSNTGRLTTIGNSGNDTLDGGDGNDTLDGGSGNDKLIGGTGNDVLFGGFADYNDTAGAKGRISLNNAGNDTLDGGDGNDNIAGGEGNDSLIGGAGNDLLDGGTGNDIMKGGDGSDTYIIDNALDVVSDVGLSISDIDTVYSSVAFNLAAGAGMSIENLTFTGVKNLNAIGNASNNVIFGNFGNNNLDGGVGNDTIDSGWGMDTMTGGAGIDKFVFSSTLSSAGNNDLITDFVHGTDKIMLNSAIFTGVGGALDAANIVMGTGAGATAGNATLNYSNGILSFDADGTTGGNTNAIQVALIGSVSHPTLSAADFLIV